MYCSVKFLEPTVIVGPPPPPSEPPPSPTLPQAAISASADRKSTRLNSSHANISYAVFCLKKKNLKNPLFKDHLVPRFCHLKVQPLIIHVRRISSSYYPR